MAIVTTLAISGRIDIAIVALAIGGAIGWVVAKRVEMTQMPELVAAMHSLVGLAAVLIAFAVVSNPLAFNIPFPIPRGNRDLRPCIEVQERRLEPVLDLEPVAGAGYRVGLHFARDFVNRRRLGTAMQYGSPVVAVRHDATSVEVTIDASPDRIRTRSG